MSDVFKRIEKKYVINSFQHDELISRFNEYMRKDYYSRDGAYTIYNIYFDNDSNTMIHKSNMKPVFKEKIRIRTYDITDSEHCSFLEIKRKISKTVSKRRIAAPYGELEKFIYNNEVPSSLTKKEKQIAQELSYSINQYNSYPKVFLSYKREAFYDKENDDFRVTFDKDIIYRYDNVNFSSGNYGKNILNQDSYIMEIKFENALPLWITRLLSELKIYPTSYSKYGEIYKNEIRENKNV